MNMRKGMDWMMMSLAITLFAVSSANGFTEDRTLQEFKDYAKERLSNLNDDQLSQLAKMVDRDGDGVISDAEFEQRMEAVQKLRNSAEDQGEEPEKAEQPSSWERMNDRMRGQLEEAGIALGKPSPEATGLDIDGNPFRLADLKGHYSVIVNGCLT